MRKEISFYPITFHMKFFLTAGLVRKRGDHVVPWTTTMTGTVDHLDVILVVTALVTAITDVMIDLAGTGTAEVRS